MPTEFSSAVATYLPYGVGVWDASKATAPGEVVFAWANAATEAQSEGAIRALVGKTMAEAFPPFVGTTLGAAIFRVARDGGTYTEEICYGDIALPENWFRATVFSLGNHCASVMYENISAERLAWAELARNADTLRQVNLDLERYIHMASHDLKQPLRTMVGMISLVKRRSGDNLDETSLRQLDQAIEGAERMKRLIDNVLAYSDTRNRAPAREDVQLRDVVADAQAALGAAIQERDAQIRVGELPTVVGDRVLLTELFQNLIGNALKYSHPDRTPTVEVEATQDDEGWRIAVRDNGLGFDPNYAHQVFQPFKRLHSARTHEGSGIGLAICQHIVTTHGGDIAAQTEPGVGSTFSFTLPMEGAA